MPQDPEGMVSVSAGGPRLRIALRQQPFQPLELLADWQRQLADAPLQTASVQALQSPSAAPVPAGLPAPAESHFIGRVRACTASGEPLEALELEHYPGMCESQLQALADDCATRHGVQAVLVIHRVGRILPGEAIVLVAVSADRRGMAQRCCQELLEALKHDAPFWKREWSGGRGIWLQGNTPL